MFHIVETIGMFLLLLNWCVVENLWLIFEQVPPRIMKMADELMNFSIMMIFEEDNCCIEMLFIVRANDP